MSLDSTLRKQTNKQKISDYASHTHTHTHAHTHTHIHTHMQTQAHTCTHTHTHAHILRCKDDLEGEMRKLLGVATSEDKGEGTGDWLFLRCFSNCLTLFILFVFYHRLVLPYMLPIQSAPLSEASRIEPLGSASTPQTNPQRPALNTATASSLLARLPGPVLSPATPHSQQAASLIFTSQTTSVLCSKSSKALPVTGRTQNRVQVRQDPHDPAPLPASLPCSLLP